MSKFKVKKLPPIKLIDLLKKRKTNLKQFLFSSGITTYVTLEHKCNSLGVLVPTIQEFHEASGGIVSSPQEGVVVLDPPLLLKETGEKIEIEEKILDAVVQETKVLEPVDELKLTDIPTSPSNTKSWKKKKDSQTVEE